MAKDIDARKLKDEVAEFLKKQKWEKAADLLETLAKAEPKDMSHRLKLGDTYRRLEQIQKAVAAYQFAAKFFGDEGQLIKAIGAVKVILEIDPKNEEAQKQLAEMNKRRFGKVTLESAGLAPAKAIGAGARATSSLELEEASHAAMAVAGVLAPGLADRAPEPQGSPDDEPLELDDGKPPRAPPRGATLSRAPPGGPVMPPRAPPGGPVMPPRAPAGGPAIPARGFQGAPPAKSASPSPKAVYELDADSGELDLDLAMQVAKETTRTPGARRVPAPPMTSPREELDLDLPAETLPDDAIVLEHSEDPAGADDGGLELIDDLAPPPLAAPGKPTAPAPVTPKAAPPAARASPPPAPAVLPASPKSLAPPPAAQPRPPPAAVAKVAPPAARGTPQVSFSDEITFEEEAPRKPKTQPPPPGMHTAQPIADLLSSESEEEIELLSISSDEEAAGERPMSSFKGTPDEADLDRAFGEMSPQAKPQPKKVPAKKVPLFDDLSQDAFVELVNKLAYHRHVPGQLIIREGDPGRSFYVIVEGKVRIFKTGPEGKEITLAYLSEGAFFGEMALLSGAPRTANVVAEEDTEILEVTDVVLRDLATRHPAVINSLKNFYRQRLLNNVMAISPLFKDFDPHERKGIVEKFRMKQAAASEVLITEGKNSDGLYVVLHGQVVVTAKKGNAPVELARLKEGEIFGEMSLLTRKPATATVAAQVNSILLRLPRENFQELVLTHPQILELVSDLTEKRKDATDAILHGQVAGHDGMSFV